MAADSASNNGAGVAPEILAAVQAANTCSALADGGDDHSAWSGYPAPPDCAEQLDDVQLVEWGFHD